MSNQTSANKVVVFSSGGFALPLIEFLLSKNILAGVIIPDPSEVPHIAAEVNNLAAQLHHANIPYQACCKEKLPIIVNQLDAWQASLGIVASFSYIIPDLVCKYFHYGLYNLHASNLPYYKGPMPIYWQIRYQEKSISLCLHHVTEAVDAGAIVAQEVYTLHPRDTLQSATNQLSRLAVKVVEGLLSTIDKGNAIPNGQAQIVIDSQVGELLPGKQYARYPTLADGVINPEEMTAQEINALCRSSGSSTFSASILFKGVPINVVEASVVDYPSYGTKPGTILFVGDPEGLIIQVKDSSLRLDILANADGIFSGLSFAERFQIDAGMQMQASLFTMQQQ